MQVKFFRESCGRGSPTRRWRSSNSSRPALSNKAIGERLVVSVRTVERHTLNIYAKLGVRSRAEAVAVGLHRSEQIGSA